MQYKFKHIHIPSHAPKLNDLKVLTTSHVQGIDQHVIDKVILYIYYSHIPLNLLLPENCD